MNPQHTNTTLPAWFAAPTPNLPISEVPKKSPRKKRGVILTLVALLIIAGSVIGYISLINQQRANYFNTFHSAYITLESGLIGFTDITEPDDLAASESPDTTWKQYIEAINTLTTTSLYGEKKQLIDEISAASLNYEPYVTRVLPSMLTYLIDCYTTGNTTMIGATCRAHIQVAANAGDPLSRQLLNALLATIDAASSDGVLSESESDSILDLQTKIFALGSTIVDSVGKKVVALGQSLNIDVLRDDT